MSGYELLMTQLDGKPLAVEVSTILEVINAVETTGFIDKPKGVIGLINLRGDIVPVHDLRHHIGVDSRELLSSDQIIIIADGGVKVGVAVDKIETVQTFQEEQLFAQSLSPTAFKILTVKNREIVFAEIRSILES